MSRGVSQNTKKMTMGALLSAMGVALLFIGSLIETLDLSMSALASFLCIFAVIEMGGMYPWMIFGITGILSVVFAPYSMAGWFYILFFGYYPILKEKLERLNKTIAWILKIIILNVAVWIWVAVAYLVLFGQGSGQGIIDMFNTVLGDVNADAMLAIAVYALINIVFIIYDIALTRIISFYIIKLRHRLKFLR